MATFNRSAPTLLLLIATLLVSVLFFLGGFSDRTVTAISSDSGGSLPYLKSALCWNNVCPSPIKSTLAPKEVIINHHIFLLRYNTQTKFADWVAYIVKKDNITKVSNSTLSHKRIWKTDPYIRTHYPSLGLKPSDYKGAYAKYHYDRGHQAPLASFKYNTEGGKTNYLSNITPQKSALNRGAWKKLEAAIRKAAYKKTLYIVTGALYDGKPQPPLPHASIPHKVPTGYWKMVTYTGADHHTACVAAFTFSQDTHKNDTYCAHQADIKQLEKRIHYTLLPQQASVKTMGQSNICVLALC